MMRWTKGINLERSTLRDRVEKLISHLGGLETENEAKRMSEGAPTEEEEDPRELPSPPLKLLVTGGKIWRGGATDQTWTRERGVLKRGQRFRGLNTPGPAPGRTLVGLVTSLFLGNSRTSDVYWVTVIEWKEENGNDDSSNITSRETQMRPFDTSRQLKPLCKLLYPRKTHLVERSSCL
jgi:hypothetical protein